MIASFPVMMLVLAVAQAGCPHSSGKRKILRDFLSESDRVTIRSTWTNIRENANVAPKTFLRYFELKPESQKLFPDFADVDPSELPTNDAFIAQADICVSGLNSYIQHLGENPKKCPFVAKANGKYHHDDLKVLLQTFFFTFISG